MIRVFYWLQGVPQNRIGGPWWARDFEQDVRGMEFATEIKNICWKVRYSQYNIGDTIPAVDHQLVDPPECAKEI